MLTALYMAMEVHNHSQNGPSSPDDEMIASYVFLPHCVPLYQLLLVLVMNEGILLPVYSFTYNRVV